MNYSPSDCFETFPFPLNVNKLETFGNEYDDFRRALMLSRGEGLTKIYNRLHNRHDASEDVRNLRELTMAMDKAVAAAYGWANVKLDHDFHETKQGVRFTISELARQEVLARLLALNHERYADEVRLGLHERTGSRWSRDDEEETNECLFTDEEQR